jgi:hypothetical protein
LSCDQGSVIFLVKILQKKNFNLKILAQPVLAWVNVVVVCLVCFDVICKILLQKKFYVKKIVKKEFKMAVIKVLRKYVFIANY